MEHHAAATPSINQLATQATVHCLTGCSIGEILGLVIATALDWHDLPSIVLSIVLAFVFGYGLTIRPLLASRDPARTGESTRVRLGHGVDHHDGARRHGDDPADPRRDGGRPDGPASSGAASRCHWRSPASSPGRSTAG